ncbi:hypothetical protein CF327_g6711, partial [Tilletia walkeri]
MTESVAVMDEAAIRAAMQAELDGVDALARYRWDNNYNIFEFGETIDAIPNATPALTDSLRQVAYAFDEPDTRAEAFNSTPSLSYPESQERYKAVRERPTYGDYLQFSSSQSQQMSSQSQASQAHSTPSAFRAPPSRQPQRLQIPRNDPEPPSVRRSPRGVTQSRRLSGYAVGEDAEESSRATRRTSGPGPSSERQGNLGFTPSPSKRLELSSSDSDEAEEAPLGSQRSALPVSGDLRQPAPKKPKGSASKSSKDSSSKAASRHPPAPPTRAERQQHASAAKIVTPARQNSNRPPESEVITIEDDGDDSPRVRRVLEGKNARKRFMEGDIAISVAAKNSILGAVQDVDAYDG